MKIHKSLLHVLPNPTSGARAVFHHSARKLFRSLVSDLGLTVHQVRIGSSLGEGTSCGASTLRTHRLHARISDQNPGEDVGIWYRTSSGIDDRTGGLNSWISISELSTAEGYRNFLCQLRLIVGLRIDGPRIFTKRHYSTAAADAKNSQGVISTCQL